MLIQSGAKVFIAHRRLYADDQPRFFIGTIEEYGDGLAKISGYSWVREQVHGDILRKKDQRTKIVSLASGTLIVYVLPDEVEVENLSIEHGPDRDYALTDGKGFQMDLSERRQIGS
ncbi:MAG: hypothetical protein GY725_01285 [bacterium]|nr:hypothetical protein [bacterium]